MPAPIAPASPPKALSDLAAKAAAAGITADHFATMGQAMLAAAAELKAWEEAGNA